jgi:hypothetical protein
MLVLLPHTCSFRAFSAYVALTRGHLHGAAARGVDCATIRQSGGGLDEKRKPSNLSKNLIRFTLASLRDAIANRTFAFDRAPPRCYCTGGRSRFGLSRRVHVNSRLREFTPKAASTNYVSGC